MIAFFHGGGVRKEQVGLSVLPFLAADFAVANIEYRMLDDAVAPAAVLDAVCATRWLVHEAPAEYRVNERDLILTGNSAGGHLALMAGLANEAFGEECTHLRPIRPRAVVNLFGVSNFERFMFEEPVSPGIAWAQRWLGRDRQLARAMSPVRYVRAVSPSVLSVHGTDDRLVPIQQSFELHNKLSEIGIPNQLLRIAGGEHGGYWTAWRSSQLSIVENGIIRFINQQLGL
jgi:acetyl esterase/lipase